MKQKILQTIKDYNLIENGDKIVIGVSGGPDSICLLHVLNEIKKQIDFEIYVAHINHMIREEADEETEYVKKFCNQIKVECYVKKIDVQKQAKEEKRGSEETGRKIRYEFFNEILEKTKSNKIAIAHNNNDKIETIIMNILRGTGMPGLRGIEAIRNGKYIRPLINIERKEIEKYCEENNLNPRYDKTNNENFYTRNKIRNIVIPYIKQEFNPNIEKVLNRLSEVATEEDEYLNKVTKHTYKNLLITSTEEQIILDLKLFNSLELVIKRRIILYTINELLSSTVGIEKVNIDDIIKMCEKNIGNKYLKPIKEIKILVKNKKIFFTIDNNLP